MTKRRRRRAEWGLGFDLHTTLADKIELIVGVALVIGVLVLFVIPR